METLKERTIRLFNEGKITVKGLLKAYDGGVITADCFQALANETVDHARERIYGKPEEKTAEEDADA